MTNSLSAPIYTLVFILISSCSPKIAAIDSCEYEQYDYPVYQTENNLANNVFCPVIQTYYSELKERGYGIKQTIDTIQHRRNIQIVTKNAGAGYLAINEAIMHKLSEIDDSQETIIINYYYNNQLVNDKDAVIRLVQLKKSKIKYWMSVYDRSNRIVCIYIY